MPRSCRSKAACQTSQKGEEAVMSFVAPPLAGRGVPNRTLAAKQVLVSYASSVSSSAFASFRSGVSNPSVNEL